MGQSLAPFDIVAPISAIATAFAFDRIIAMALLAIPISVVAAF